MVYFPICDVQLGPLHSEANRDPRFQASLLVWSSPEFRLAFASLTLNGTKQENIPELLIQSKSAIDLYQNTLQYIDIEKKPHEL